MELGLPLTADALLTFGDPARHDPAVPTTEKVLGYRLGDRLSRHADVLRYCDALADTRRAALLPYGRSVEGRALVQLVVAAPEHLRRLDAVRAGQQRLADPGAAPPELDSQPVVVWVMANVHGGEHSSAEAALALAYELCASTHPASELIRRQAVVVIDPLQNPDGRDRSVNNYYALGGLMPSTDPRSAEHACPWPGPRGSHYAFDLNRDWCLLTHPETRARVASMLAWRPQVVVDLHEMYGMGGYYFPPPAPPVEQNVPDAVRRWWEVFGRANAAAFDRRGWDYFIGECFDSFYPGYGESWPLYQGAVGMTFEQDTARTLGVADERGSVMTLAESTAHHLVAAWTVCHAAATQRQELLSTYRATRVRLAHAEPTRRALLLDAADRAADAADVAALLRAQGVAVNVAAEPFQAVAEPQLGGEAATHDFAAGSLVVSLSQPSAGLVKVLCERDAPMPADYTAEENERLAHRAETTIYDVTSWSLPHRVGLTAWWTADEPAVPDGYVAPEPEAAGVAWLLPMATRGAYQALCRLLARPYGDDGVGDWHVRVASRAFTFAGRPYDRGTVVLFTGDHGEDALPRLRTLAATTGLTAVSADSAWAEGQFSLGSSWIRPVKRPRVALLTRPPVRADGAGWMAYHLEQVYRLPYTPLACEGLSAARLKHYDVLLLPEGDGYSQVLGEKGEVLAAWVEAGGVLVALGGQAAAWLAGCGKRFTTAATLEDLRALDAPPEPPLDDVDAPSIPPEHWPVHLAGVSAWAETDRYSYLTYGCPARMLVPLLGRRLFWPPTAGHTICRLGADEPIGWVPHRMRAALAGRAWLWQETVGAGQVICFAVPPTFRASWPMLDRLWLNAVLYGPSRTRE